MNTVLVVVLNVGLAAAVYLFLVRRIDRRLEPGKIVDNIRGEIEGIIVELNQTTDRNIGLIEDRVNQLNRVLEQADRRLSLLKREMESRSQSTDRYNDILKRARENATRGAPPSGADAGAPSGADAGRKPTDGDTAGHGSQGAGDQTSGSQGAGGQEPTGRTARRKQIIDLHRKGIAANIIANRTGTTVGEVELVISLSERSPQGES